MKPIKLFPLILVFILLTGCVSRGVALDEQNPSTVSLKSNAGRPVISQGKQFKITGDFEHGWHYLIYDKEGNVVDSGSGYRIPPDIKYTSVNIIELRFHGGTYADSCRYYNVDTARFSDYYGNPFLVRDNIIVYFDAKIGMLIARDIFDKSVFYKEIKLKSSICLTVPPVSIRLIDNDKRLILTYLDEFGTRSITETLELN